MMSLATVAIEIQLLYCVINTASVSLSDMHTYIAANIFYQDTNAQHPFTMLKSSLPFLVIVALSDATRPCNYGKGVTFPHNPTAPIQGLKYTCFCVNGKWAGCKNNNSTNVDFPQNDMRMSKGRPTAQKDRCDIQYSTIHSIGYT